MSPKPKETILKTLLREYHGWKREFGEYPAYFELTKDQIKELRKNILETTGDSEFEGITFQGIPIKIVPRRNKKRKDTKTLPLFQENL